MQSLSPQELAAHGSRVPTGLPLFDPEAQQRRVCGLVRDIITAGR
jgi:hypothetical protein